MRSGTLRSRMRELLPALLAGGATTGSIIRPALALAAVSCTLVGWLALSSPSLLAMLCLLGRAAVDATNDRTVTAVNPGTAVISALTIFVGICAVVSGPKRFRPNAPLSILFSIFVLW